MDTNLNTFSTKLSSINDNDIFILNPVFRIRKNYDRVLVYGASDIGSWDIHTTYGVLLALCNGKRSVSDIAHQTKFFSKQINIDEETAYIDTLEHIKHFFHFMTKSKEEQNGEKQLELTFPSHAPLLLKKNYDKLFGKLKVFRMKYDANKLIHSKEYLEYPFDSKIRYELPAFINWHVTSACSTSCKYCYLSRRDVNPMEKNMALRLVNESAKDGILGFSLGGGDVLLYPYIIDVLESMHDMKFLPFGIATKSFLDVSLAKRLSHFKELLNEIQFSIDTDDDEIAHYLVGVPGYSDRIFSSIKNAINADLQVSAKAVITPYNILTIPRLYHKLKQLGVSSIRLASYSRSAYHHSDDLYLSTQSYDWLEDQVRKLQDLYPSDTIYIQNGPPVTKPYSMEEKQKAWKNRSRCSAGRSSMMICTDGKAIPCEQMPEREKYFCGDTTIQSIKDIWNGKLLKDMTCDLPIEKFRDKPCYECLEREECHNINGYCIRDLAMFFDDIYQPPSNCYLSTLPFFRQT